MTGRQARVGRVDVEDITRATLAPGGSPASDQRLAASQVGEHEGGQSWKAGVNHLGMRRWLSRVPDKTSRVKLVVWAGKTIATGRALPKPLNSIRAASEKPPGHHVVHGGGWVRVVSSVSWPGVEEAHMHTHSRGREEEAGVLLVGRPRGYEHTGSQSGQVSL